MEKNKLSKKEIRKQKRIEKIQKRDFERYGIKPEDIKNKSTKTNWKALKQCFKYFLPYKFTIALIIILAFVYAGFTILFPILTEKGIDAVSNSDFSTAIIFFLVFMCIAVIRIVVIYFWDYLALKTNNNVTKKIRTDLITNTFNTKLAKYDTVNSGEVISRINNDSSNISQIIIDIVNSAAEVLTSLAFVAYFFVLNVWIGIGVVAVVVGYTLLDSLYQKYNQSMNKKEKYLNDKNVGIISEIVRAIKDIKALNIKKSINKKYNTNVDNLFNVSNDRAKYGYILLNLAWAFIVVMDFVLIAIGIVGISTGILALSVFIVFLIYKDRTINIVHNINFIRRELKSTSLSAERICEILNEDVYPKEKFGTKTIKNPKGEIEFKDITFSYNNKTNVFENFNLKIEANTTVAFVGKSGHGKSTLINLIPKLYDLNSGKLLIDGEDITTLSEDGLRDLVTIVPQTPYIFNTSIRENLSIVKPDMTDEEMIDVCKKAQIHDFIMKKEGGYDSVVGENGLILSGGQKQRIAIARALLKNSRIILLDEATSALDNESQEKIKEALDSLGGQHTIIIIAHRLSTVVNADKIVVIEKGKIVGEGTHEELIKNCVEYQNLYNIKKKNN